MPRTQPTGAHHGMTTSTPVAPGYPGRRSRIRENPVRPRPAPATSPGPGRSTLGVAIVDDDSLTRGGMRALIASQRDMRVLDEASDTSTALATLAVARPDLVIVEARLAGANQGAAIRTIRRSLPGTKILAFGFGTLEEEIFQVLDAGAAGYLIRKSAPSDLVGAIRRVQSGGRYIPEEIQQRLEQRRRRPQLTPRERNVLELLAQARSNATIGVVLGISVGTVKLHVKAILAKLGVEDRAEAALVARQRGFICDT
ncbi:MAG TPA: response regulator transcription factor [Polyangia bacterium]|nr:response regulator transcription factor [Polyangia bacterium]